MAKKCPSFVKNSADGFDLIVEKDAGNEVRILTGDLTNSKKFWKNLKLVAEVVLAEIEFKESES